MFWKIIESDMREEGNLIQREEGDTWCNVRPFSSLIFVCVCVFVPFIPGTGVPIGFVCLFVVRL